MLSQLCKPDKVNSTACWHNTNNKKKKETGKIYEAKTNTVEVRKQYIHEKTQRYIFLTLTDTAVRGERCHAL